MNHLLHAVTSEPENPSPVQYDHHEEERSSCFENLVSISNFKLRPSLKTRDFYFKFSNFDVGQSFEVRKKLIPAETAIINGAIKNGSLFLKSPIQEHFTKLAR